MFLELERKLQAAYMTRERTLQMTEKEHLTATQRQEELKTAREIEEDLKQAELEGLSEKCNIGVQSCILQTQMIWVSIVLMTDTRLQILF